MLEFLRVKFQGLRMLVDRDVAKGPEGRVDENILTF